MSVERVKNGVNLPAEDAIRQKSEDICPVQQALKVARQAREDCCGRGVFCREGLTELSLIIGDVAENRGSADDLDTLRHLCTQIMLGADCDAAYEGARLIFTSLELYGDDWEAHVIRHRCKTGQCAAFPKPAAPAQGQPTMRRRRRM